MKEYCLFLEIVVMIIKKIFEGECILWYSIVVYMLNKIFWYVYL